MKKFLKSDVLFKNSREFHIVYSQHDDGEITYHACEWKNNYLEAIPCFTRAQEKRFPKWIAAHASKRVQELTLATR